MRDAGRDTPAHAAPRPPLHPPRPVLPDSQALTPQVITRLGGDPDAIRSGPGR
jgi:hypothetical protein